MIAPDPVNHLRQSRSSINWSTIKTSKGQKDKKVTRQRGNEQKTKGKPNTFCAFILPKQSNLRLSSFGLDEIFSKKEPMASYSCIKITKKSYPIQPKIRHPGKKRGCSLWLLTLPTVIVVIHSYDSSLSPQFLS